MDTHHLGIALLTSSDVLDKSRRPWTETSEDAYYREFAPVDRRAPRVLPVVVVVMLGLVSAGIWLA